MKRVKETAGGRKKRKKETKDEPVFESTSINTGNHDEGAEGPIHGSPEAADLENEENIQAFYLENCAGLRIGEEDDHVEGGASWLKIRQSGTPLERQVAEIKRQNPDVVLFVECGYRYRFFGEDAETASKELNIQCNPSHNVVSGSIPVHRLKVHLMKLVNKGYKVGVVRQKESALTKSPAHKVFTRDLDAVYTKGTLVGESVSLENVAQSPGCDESDGPNAAGRDELSSGFNKFILAVTESVSFEKRGGSKKLAIPFGLIAVDVSTDEVFYDWFNDDASRSGFCKRLHHINPCEIVVDRTDASVGTLRIIQAFVDSRASTDPVRIESVPADYFDYGEALVRLCSSSSDVSEEESSCRRAEMTEFLNTLPTYLVGCFGALGRYLSAFNLAKTLHRFERWTKLSSCTGVMELTHVTARALEVTENFRDGRVEGSLLSYLDHTKTAFGRRLLRRWLCQPLTDAKEISRRLDAVESLRGRPEFLESVTKLMTHGPDVEKVFTAASHGKCGTAELCRAAESLQNVAAVVGIQLTQHMADGSSQLLEEILGKLAASWRILDELLLPLDRAAALEGDKTRVFLDPYMNHELGLKLDEVSKLKEDLEQALPLCNDPFGTRIVTEFVTKGVHDYLIEIPNKYVRLVPSDWNCISMTKHFSRFRPPEIENHLKSLNVAKEELHFVAARAWTAFLAQKTGLGVFDELRSAVWALATFDVLAGFAVLSLEKGLTRPEIVDQPGVLVAKQSFHPLVASYVENRGGGRSYVRNDVNLEAAKTHCMIVSGPNMGGKSCYVKQVGVMVIMAQVGCFVPAENCRMSIFDNVLVRVGGEIDEGIFRISGKSEGFGGSSFLGETRQVSEILHNASEKSLVIIDEFGRGTATHDGTALASAVLRWVIEKVRSLCLFVTHYPEVCKIASDYRGQVENFHMNFMVERVSRDKDADENEAGLQKKLTLLYEVVSGRASSSFGLNAARLAGLPQEVLEVASDVARRTEEAATRQRNENLAFASAWNAASVDDLFSVPNDYSE